VASLGDVAPLPSRRRVRMEVVVMVVTWQDCHVVVVSCQNGQNGGDASA
jgi:hypothetical protein